MCSRASRGGESIVIKVRHDTSESTSSFAGIYFNLSVLPGDTQKNCRLTTITSVSIVQNHAIESRRPHSSAMTCKTD